MPGGFPLLDWLFTAFTPFIYSIDSFIPLIECYRAFHVHDTLFYIVFHHLWCHCCLLLSFQFGTGVFSSSRVVGGRYLYTSDLLKLRAFCQADVNPSWARAPTPISQNHLASLLSSPRQVFCNVAVEGLYKGFPIGLIQPGVTYGQWHAIILPHFVIGSVHSTWSAIGSLGWSSGIRGDSH